MILSNLSTLFWHLEEFEISRPYSIMAIDIASTLENPRQLAYGKLCLGYALLSLGHAIPAQMAFEESVNIRRSVKGHQQRIDSLAGLAICNLVLGNQSKALELLEEIWDFVVNNEGIGNRDPIQVYSIYMPTVLKADGAAFGGESK